MGKKRTNRKWVLQAKYQPLSYILLEKIFAINNWWLSENGLKHFFFTIFNQIKSNELYVEYERKKRTVVYEMLCQLPGIVVSGITNSHQWSQNGCFPILPLLLFLFFPSSFFGRFSRHYYVPSPCSMSNTMVSNLFRILIKFFGLIISEKL